MADICDQAQQHIEAEEAMRRVDLRPVALATGFCLYCDEPLPTGHRWCDDECRDGWDYERSRRR